MKYSKTILTIITFGFILIFSGCTVTIPTVYAIRNAELSNYKIVEKENIDKIKHKENIILYFVDGDSLKGKYIGNQQIASDNSDTDTTVENDVKSEIPKGILIAHISKISLIPLKRIKGIRVDHGHYNITIGLFRSMLGGLAIDSLIIFLAYATALSSLSALGN